jgi:hypothetical protein
MATTDEEPSGVPGQLSDRLGKLLAASSSPGSLAKLKSVWVAESFQVWTTTLKEILYETDVPLRQRAVWTGVWHHQLRASAEGPAVAFARSLEEGGQLEPRSIHFSSLAGEIDRAVQWVDANLPDDAWVARLLEVPEQRLPMLWLERGKENLFGILLGQGRRTKRKFRAEPFYSESELRSYLQQ